MKNRQLVYHINTMDKILEKEKERPESKKLFCGRAVLLMRRNLRALIDEYNKNYLKDLTELRERFFVTKETDATIPEDKEKGIEEHTEKRTVEVLKDGVDAEQYEKELTTLLDLNVSVKISKIHPEDVEKVTDFETLDELDFMVE